MFKKILSLITVFLLGAAAAGLVSPMVKATNLELTTNFEDILPPEQASPKDRIKESQIQVYPDKVIIDVKNTRWSTFTDTNSMDPVIDIGANAIQVIPQTPEELQKGDIISYETEFGTIIHRIVKTGYDEKGWYAIAKGDNNKHEDPGKIRFEQVKRIVVAVIY